MSEFVSTVRTLMPRPKDSAYNSHKLIYWRLIQGVFWLDDWKSTGLKSRATVNARLKYLLKCDLIQKKRQGHKMVYSIKSPYHAFWNKYLWSERSFKEQWEKLAETLISAHGKQRLQRIDEALEKKQALVRSWYSVTDSDIKAFVHDFEKEPRYRDGVFPPIPADSFLVLLNDFLNGKLCSDCRRNKEAIYYVTDAETGEQVCPRCGLVRAD